jgi:translation initiation factor IF-3
VNRGIRVPQVRVIDENGTMLGVMATIEAVKIAEERGLDLMEVAPTAQPPTCKIGDYGKWKYENKKKTVAARKKQIIVLTKEIQLRPRTDTHDFDTKMNHAKRFLLDGDKVKVNMRFSGREMAHQEVGLSLMRKVIETLNELCLVETNPKTEGRQAFLIVAPDPMKIKDYKKKHNIVDKKVEDDEDETEKDKEAAT